MPTGDPWASTATRWGNRAGTDQREWFTELVSRAAEIRHAAAPRPYWPQRRGSGLLFGVPDDVHEEIVTLITAVARAPKLQAPELAAVFGEWCWVVYTSHGDVIEVLDVGCAR
ncbi:hypothetical protein GCM10010317_000750 [Streptomyces mirabilis]|uniref:hypothetical protein n=1 Tax=Streptomyces mirabilis TaxID=68239 RepID=UPI0019A6A00D|nr:hypothetical protein GCM10010317_000750 [Streptomyces mirabilis]